MAGVKIPVLEVEQFWLKSGGRGIHAYHDGTILDASTGIFTGVSSQVGSPTRTFLPAYSTSAWLKVTYDDAGTSTDGYIPIWPRIDLSE